jgi:hypothetical protein
MTHRDNVIDASKIICRLIAILTNTLIGNSISIRIRPVITLLMPGKPALRSSMG